MATLQPGPIRFCEPSTDLLCAAGKQEVALTACMRKRSPSSVMDKHHRWAITTLDLQDILSLSRGRVTDTTLSGPLSLWERVGVRASPCGGMGGAAPREKPPRAGWVGPPTVALVGMADRIPVTSTKPGGRARHDKREPGYPGLRADIQGLRSDIQNLRSDIQDLLAELFVEDDDDDDDEDDDFDDDEDDEDEDEDEDDNHRNGGRL